MVSRPPPLDCGQSRPADISRSLLRIERPAPPLQAARPESRLARSAAVLPAVQDHMEPVLSPPAHALGCAFCLRGVTRISSPLNTSRNSNKMTVPKYVFSCS